MLKHTPFFQSHLDANAKMVDFAGWQMPLHYGSQIKEHHLVRREVGMFDVSHMGIVDCYGIDAKPYLSYLLANDVDKITVGKALYTCMLNERGGVIDDLIVYELGQNFYRLIINAGTKEKDINWLKTQQAHFDIAFNIHNDLAMLAIQGPKAEANMMKLFKNQIDAIAALKSFTCLWLDDWLIARTGYTGENGYEIILPANAAAAFWQQCLALGISPCGLGARDTLRLEAGLNLYGQDMDESVTPYESNLGWTVALTPETREFIGRDALKQKQTEKRARLVGLVLRGNGIIRSHQKVFTEKGMVGEVTSGGFSPTLEKSIALARVCEDISGQCLVEIRQKHIPALVVKPPFVRQGKQVFRRIHE